MKIEKWHPELFLALVEHHRWWFGDDGVRRRQIGMMGGQLDGRILRKIASAYSVSRGILEGQQDRLAALINEKLQDWPDGLLERAEFCVAIAQSAKQEKMTSGVLVSGMTKLMWFARPDRWTMYDDLASTGLGINRYLGTVPRMRSFYDALDKAGFERIVDTMQRLIDQSGLPYLWAARIIDKWLMHQGRDDADKQDVSAESRAYFDILNRREQEALKQLSHDLLERVGPDLSAFSAHEKQLVIS